MVSEVAAYLKESKAKAKEQKILRQVAQKRKEIVLARTRKGSFQVGESIGQFAQAGLRPAPTFSEEQDAMRSMFGGGEHVWGLGDESETQVTIHNDLNPRQRGDRGTAELFGF